jgi:putative ATPase
MATLFESQAPRPLADRLRPQTLADVVGQDHLLKDGGALARLLAAGRMASIILWGPPGTGKTTIARLLAEHTKLHYEPLSAVFSGVADLRKVFDAARKRREAGQGTLLFVDEIHRFNRSQQDSFLWKRCCAGPSRRRAKSFLWARMRAKRCARWPTATDAPFSTWPNSF